jgi:hypothetical protein
MKAKKALKRLSMVEQLLADVLDGFAGIGKDMRDLLGSAQASVVRAKKTMQPKAAAPANAKKPSAKSGKPIPTGGAKKRKKKSAPAARRVGVGTKAAKTAAKKPRVQAHKAKRVHTATESKKRPALPIKKRRRKSRGPRSAKPAQTHPAGSLSPTLSLSPTPEPLPEANTEPTSAPEGSEPVSH